MLSNWQGAIWRGAVLAFLFWAGLAWTQSPTKRSTPDGTERIMVVHENGKATRCRVLETWQLPDGRMANLLQSIESGEMITIVDEHPEGSNRNGFQKDQRGMPKRIFGWGKGRNAPPEGSPVPPHLRQDSGVIVKNDTPAPEDGVILPTPSVTIINQAVDNKALGEKYGESYEGSPIIQRPDTTAKSTGGMFPRLFPKRDSSVNKSQMIEFGSGSQSIGAGLPMANGGTPAMGQTVTFPPTGSDTPIESGIYNGGVKPEIVNKHPLLNRIKPFAPREVVEVVPPAFPTNSSAPTIVQGMESRPTQHRPLLGGLWKTPNSTPASASSSVQPVLPTTPALGIPIVGGKPGQLPANSPSSPGPLVVNGSEQPTLPTSPGVQPVPANRPLLGGLWKTPSATASNTPIVPVISKSGTPGQLPTTLPTKIGEGQATVPTKPVVTGSTAPATRPILGGLWKTPNTTAANAPVPTVPKAAGESAKKPAEAEPAKPWRPGDRITALFQGKPVMPLTTAQKAEAAKKTETSPFGDTSKPKDPTNMQKSADFLAQQNKVLEKQLQANADKIYKVPFSTAMSTSQSPTVPQTANSKDSGILSIPTAKPVAEPIFPVAPLASERPIARPEMFGTNEKPVVMPPGQSLLQPIKVPEIAKLPPAPTPRTGDSLYSPERFIPNDKLNAKQPNATLGTARPGVQNDIQKTSQNLAGGTVDPNAGPSWPLGAQSVLAAQGGLAGPVVYVPVPTVTVPAPHNPPAPPAPNVPDAPQLNMHVNGFSAPQAPKGAGQPAMYNPMGMSQNPMMNPYANPMVAQQMMQYQAMIHQQQYAMMQQQQYQYAMMQQYGYRPNPNMPPSQGPTANGGRFYAGPMPPSPMQQTMAPTFYPPPAPQPPMIQQVNYQQPAMPTQQSAMTQQVEQIIRVMRESPYPSQRESAAQSLTSFQWRAHPQIIPALVQSASQDPAPNVRAGCVNCLGRMKAAVEPVFGALQALRNDIDPRVRQEVEVAFTSLGQTPMMPGRQ